MSRRKIFETVRRRPAGRRRFLLDADVLEERTLLSNLFTTLPDPVGVTNSLAGDVYVSYNSSTSLSRQESIKAYTGSGAFIAVAMSESGSTDFAGPLVTLGSSESLPNLQAGDILEMQPDGQLFAYSPSSGVSAQYDNLGTISPNESNVYNVQTGQYLSVGSEISLANTSFGDFGVDGNDLLASGRTTIIASGASVPIDFVMRVAYSELSGVVIPTASILLDSPVTDNSTAPEGLAVNGQGTALTTLPYLPSGSTTGSAIPVAFNASGSSLSPVILNLGLPATPTIDAAGITVDGAGDFVLATGATSLLNGAPGYVSITPDLAHYTAIESTPPLNC